MTTRPGRGSFGTGFRAFADVAVASFLARQSFDALFGSAPLPGQIRGPWVGAGAQYQSRSGLFIEGQAEFFRQRGERAFVSEATIFELGVPDTLLLLPVTGTLAYRFNGRKAAPFIGGGVGQYLTSERTPFDDSSERAWNRATSYHVVGGVEFRAGRSFGLAIQGRYTRAPNALTNGIGPAFGDSDLGGLQLGLKLLIGM
jgi:opacity protein-like surface antigen